MIGLNMTVTGAEQAAQGFRRKATGIHTGLVQATRQGVDLVRKSAQDRMVPARTINVQDGNYRRLSGQKRVSARYEDGGMAGFVKVGGHTTKVRTRALQSVYGRIGRTQDLLRKKGLYIDPQSYIKGADGKFQGRRRNRYNQSTNVNLVLFRFSRHAELEDWANRADKGLQIMRHSVRIHRAALNILTTAPALRVNRPTIMTLYRAAVVKGAAS